MADLNEVFTLSNNGPSDEIIIIGNDPKAYNYALEKQYKIFKDTYPEVLGTIEKEVGSAIE